MLWRHTYFTVVKISCSIPVFNKKWYLYCI